MNWRDLLYFSKGERRALTLLSGLIAVAWLLLVLAESPVVSTRDRNEAPASSPLPGRREIPSPTPPVHRPETSGYPLQKENETAGRKISPSQAAPAHSLRRDVPSSAPAYVKRRHSFPVTEKLPAGSLVELNAADTVLLKKVPGIGSTFARRIVKYRTLLGGFYAIEQLGEVYGIDEQRYAQLKPWFTVDAGGIHPVSIHAAATDPTFRHPYLSYRQLRAIRQLIRQKGRLSGWANLQLLEEFTEYDRERLAPYLSFE